jgi:outer membrane protein assembly factor BamB/predicted Ser/Thr protein kinase
MDSTSSPKAACPRCGTPLPSNAPEGLCPQCLGALNFTGDTGFTNAEGGHKAPPTPEEIAPHFPQLEVLDCLGRGGMGVVYKARQRTLGRLVALKLLAPEREKDAHFSERFTREAQALAALNHPHIVTIHDFGQSNGYYFLIMEFVDGVNLRQLLRARKLSPEEALAIVPPLCEALQYAHERGIVHRDIKPENLLLANDGRIKVVDFGIAKMLGTEGQLAEEQAAGTPGYMAPEQCETPQHVDSRADIYSLGVVFYEMLTGELPAKELEAPSRKVAIDVRIDQVVLRALEKSPDLRWQTAAEMRTGVEEAAAARGGSTTAAPGGSPPSRWLLVAPVVVSVAICGFLSLGLFGHFQYGWLIAGAIAFALLIIFSLLAKAWQTRLTTPAAWILIGAVLAMPILGAGPLYLVLRERDERKQPTATPTFGTSLGSQLTPSAVSPSVKSPPRETPVPLPAAAHRAPGTQTPPATPASDDTAGIGVTVNEEGGRFVIASILPGSPAARDGYLKPGHEIRSIGDSGDQLASIEGWWLRDVVARLRGKEGTQVSLLVVRGGVGSTVALVRRKLPELELGREHPKTATWELRLHVDAPDRAHKGQAKFPLLWTPSEPPMIVIAKGRTLAAYSAGPGGGNLVWQSNLDAEISSAPVRGEKFSRIFVGTADKQFHALDAHGRRRWSFAPSGKVVTPPGITDQLVLVGGEDGQIFAVDTERGESKWGFGARASAISTPNTTADIIVIGSVEGSAFAIDPKEGQKKWSYHGTSPILPPILGAGDLVYLATDSEIVALDANTGDTRWAVATDATDGVIALGKEHLYVVGSARVTALTLPSGMQLWQTPAEDYVGAPVVVRDSLFVARRTGTVRRLDLAGATREQWKASVSPTDDPARFSFGPISGGGALWLLDDQGRIWRLGPATPRPAPASSSSAPFNEPAGVQR